MYCTVAAPFLGLYNVLIPPTASTTLASVKPPCCISGGLFWERTCNRDFVYTKLPYKIPHVFRGANPGYPFYQKALPPHPILPRTD
jgi:hypothetical protein